MHYEAAAGDSCRCQWRSVVVWGRDGMGGAHSVTCKNVWTATVTTVELSPPSCWLLSPATVQPRHSRGRLFTSSPPRRRFVLKFSHSFYQRRPPSTRCPFQGLPIGLGRLCILQGGLSRPLFADDAAAANLSWRRRPQLWSTTFYPGDDCSDQGTRCQVMPGWHNLWFVLASILSSNCDFCDFFGKNVINVIQSSVRTEDWITTYSGIKILKYLRRKISAAAAFQLTTSSASLGDTNVMTMNSSSSYLSQWQLNLMLVNLCSNTLSALSWRPIFTCVNVILSTVCKTCLSDHILRHFGVCLTGICSSLSLLWLTAAAAPTCSVANFLSLPSAPNPLTHLSS